MKKNKQALNIVRIAMTGVGIFFSIASFFFSLLATTMFLSVFDMMYKTGISTGMIGLIVTFGFSFGILYMAIASFDKLVLSN